MMKKVVGIVGLGLIGGSMAKALQQGGKYSVIGYARRLATCEEALACGAVEEAFTDPSEVFKRADILVLALPPDTSGVVFAQEAQHLRQGTLVTDVASTKTNLVAKVYAHLPPGVRFVSVHPMAGSEKGGFDMAKASLFERCTWIVLQDSTVACWRREDIEELSSMGESFGSRVIVLPLAEHDCFLARISHLPHAVASMVTRVAGNDGDGDLRLRLAAGGFRDVTRVAGGNPSMWREILMGNRQELLGALEALESEIRELKDFLRHEDTVGLENYLARAKEIRDKFSAL